VIDVAKLELSLKQIAECHLPEGMKALRDRNGEPWACCCGASGSTTRDEYLEHLAAVQMIVVNRYLKEEA
jgi:hypothetical protein